jgi:hypothetical protein
VSDPFVLSGRTDVDRRSKCSDGDLQSDETKGRTMRTRMEKQIKARNRMGRLGYRLNIV